MKRLMCVFLAVACWMVLGSKEAEAANKCKCVVNGKFCMIHQITSGTVEKDDAWLYSYMLTVFEGVHVNTNVADGLVVCVKQ